MASQAWVVVDGVLQLTSVRVGTGTVASPTYSFAGDTGTGFFRIFAGMIEVANAGVGTVIFSPSANGGVRLGSGMQLSWSAAVDPTGLSSDVGISRTGAGVLSVGNGTSGDQAGFLAAAGLVASGDVTTGTSGYYRWGGSKTRIGSPTDAVVNIGNNANTIGSQIKADALPTIASGFGTGAAITAGSTPFAGSINIGTGGTANTGNINFNGTAFPSAPFCVVTNAISSAVPSQAIASTTQVNIFSSSPWVANQVVSWICVSSK